MKMTLRVIVMGSVCFPSSLYHMPVDGKHPCHETVWKEKANALMTFAFQFVQRGFLMFACAAARRAIGTLNGEHDT